MTAPHYYRLPELTRADGTEADLGDVLEWYGLDPWLAGAVTHICRRGLKEGETPLAALENAAGCLARGIAFEKRRGARHDPAAIREFLMTMLNQKDAVIDTTGLGSVDRVSE